MPGGALFVGVGRFHDGGVFERSSGDLERYREVIGGESAGDRDGRDSGEVEGAGKAPDAGYPPLGVRLAPDAGRVGYLGCGTGR